MRYFVRLSQIRLFVRHMYDEAYGRRAGGDVIVSRWPAAALLAIALATCDSATGPGNAPAEITELPRALSSAEVGAIGSANAFGFELLKRLYAAPQDGQKNVFISPLSASMALGMALNGAANGTYDAMLHALGLDGLTQDEVNASYSGLVDLLLHLDSSVQIEIANSAWLDDGIPFLPDYLTRVRDAFGATVENLDLQAPGAADHINGWAADATHDRITHVITPSELSVAIAVLANALYFKGSWRSQFDPNETHDGPFYRPDGSTVTVPMMHQQKLDEHAKSGYGNSYVALDLPYGGAAFSMTVVLPTNGFTLDDLVANADDAWWRDLVDGLTDSGFEGVWMPRFQVEYGAELSDPLTDMGMGVAFSDQADFSRMVDAAVAITSATQNTFVKVDEEGTEAAAVTTIGVGIVSQPPEFHVDHPFLYAIRERLSGTIMFIGTITDPTVS
jgi:serine protease inhibitor